MKQWGLYKIISNSMASDTEAALYVHPIDNWSLNLFVHLLYYAKTPNHVFSYKSY